MQPIVFDGFAARQLWDNVKESLDLLSEFHRLQNQGRSREAERALQAFMWVCYAGTENVASREIHTVGHESRLKQIDEADPNFYSVVRRQDNVVVQLNLDGGRQEFLDFGNAVGYSAVVSLSEPGFQAYMNNASPGFKLMHDLEFMLAAPHNRRQSEFIYISSAVHIPSLSRLFAKPIPVSQPLVEPVHSADECYERVFETRKTRRTNRIGDGDIDGSEVFNVTLNQIRHLILPMWLDDNGKLATYSSYRLPVIVCPISGRGDGASLVGKAGLWPRDRDQRGHLRYMLDFSRYNADATIQERSFIRRAVEFFQ